jgi:hypothetical protein
VQHAKKATTTINKVVKFMTQEDVILLNPHHLRMTIIVILLNLHKLVMMILIKKILILVDRTKTIKILKLARKRINNQRRKRVKDKIIHETPLNPNARIIKLIKKYLIAIKYQSNNLDKV